MRRRWRWWTTTVTAVALASVCVPLGEARAGELKGRLQWSASFVEAVLPKAPKAYWEEWNGVLDPAPPMFEPARFVTVVLRGSEDQVRGCDPSIYGGDLYPRTIVVRTGVPFAVVNRDGTPHELYAEGLESFAPLETAPGQPRRLRVGQAGRWVVRDRRYGHVQGHLVALADLVACAQIGDDGSWRFSDVPPGTYRLEVYVQGQVVASRSVEVPEQGAVELEQPLRLRLPASQR